MSSNGTASSTSRWAIVGRYSIWREVARIGVLSATRPLCPNRAIQESGFVEITMAKKAAKKKTVKKAAAKKKTTKKKTTKAAAEKDEDEDSKGKKKKAAKKKATKRKSRSKKDVKVRQRISWTVFNHAMKPVAKYAWNQRKAAEKKARELSPEGKLPHFVQKIKEEIVEE